MDDLDAMLRRSMEELRLKTSAHDGAWHLGEADWKVDLSRAEIVFRARDLVASAPVQVIGTFDTDDSSWLWAWANPSLPVQVQRHALGVRAYGAARGWDLLTEARLALSEEDAWELTALAVKLCGAQGAYRGPAGNARVFMSFGEVQLSHA